jgi:hypothetical protein
MVSESMCCLRARQLETELLQGRTERQKFGRVGCPQVVEASLPFMQPVVGALEWHTFSRKDRALSSAIVHSWARNEGYI